MAYWIAQEKCNGCDACKRICPAQAVSGEKKAPHEISPEACIECGACAKVCPKGAVYDPWKMPGTRIKKSLWEKPVFDNTVCMSCGVCVGACPAGCLSMEKQAGHDPHPYPVLADKARCIACGFCVDDCPVEAVSMQTPVAA